MDGREVEQLLAQVRRFGTEATGTEVKASRTEVPKSVKETLSSFSNMPGGGTLLLGVRESSDFTVVGVEDPSKLQHDLASMCRTDVYPPLVPLIDVHEVDGAPVVTAQIVELDRTEKPCYVTSLGMNRGSFVRVADGDRRLTTEEVQRLVADRGQPLFDSEIVEEARVEDLDSAALESYAERLREANPRVFAGAAVADILRMTSVTKRGPHGEQRPTVAGLLALGVYPQQFFPQLDVTFVHYPHVKGSPPGRIVRFLDNVSVNGAIPIMAQEVLRAINRNMSRRALITEYGRRDMWEYPPEALREAVVNAMVHRDLSPGSRGQQVQIEMYPDRLLVKNAGGLFGSVDVTTLGEDNVSSARNATLMRLLEDVYVPGEDRTVCENRGSGIRTMREALREAGMGLPVFRNKVTNFEVELPNHSLLDDETVRWLASIGREGLKDTQCTALALMRAGEVFDNAKYRAATGISDSRVATFELQDLVARELIVQHGSRAGARYTLSEYASGAAEPTAGGRSRPDRRRQILDTLGLRGQASKSEISTLLSINPKTVEHWLRVLRGEGLVQSSSSKRGARNVTYSVTGAARREARSDEP